MAIAFNVSAPKDGLMLGLDAGNPKSYPGTGTSWYDLSGRGNTFTILSTAYNASGKYMNFNGLYGCAKKQTSDFIMPSKDLTLITWTRVKNNNSAWRTLLRGLSSGSDHQIIIEQTTGWNIGMYDNINGTGFNSSGFSQQNIPGNGTSQWAMLVWRWNNSSSPYYSFSYNDTPDVVRGSITSTNARFKCGVCSIGAYGGASQNDASSASQYWGDIASIAFYDHVLYNDEIKSYYYATKGRYGL